MKLHHKQYKFDRTYKAIPICIDKPAHNGYMIIIMDNMIWTRVGIVKWPELRSPPYLYSLQPVDALQWDDDNVEVARCWPMTELQRGGILMHLCAFPHYTRIFLCSLSPSYPLLSAFYAPPSKTRAGAYYSLQTNLRIHVMREYDIPRGAPRGRKELNR